jgi:DHA1 family purine base/nucleoside efflux pump-like MFS transporter
MPEIPGWSWALAGAAFVFFTDDYAIAGVLPEIAAVFAVAAALAPEARRERYLAVVSIGVTGSIAAGVPLGAWIGGEFGWRATFAAVAVAGALAGSALLATVPARPAPRLGDQLAVLTRRPITLGLLANAITLAGSMLLLLSYFAPR